MLMYSYIPNFLIVSAVYVLLLYSGCSVIFAQDTTDLKHIYEAVHIDPIIVSASRFDVQDFINMVEKDETFYIAFSNLRHIRYTATNHLTFFNKKSINIASYYSQTIQYVDNNGCRSMKVKEESTSGKYYERRSEEPKYYTAKMYNKLFFTQGLVCPQERTINSGKGGMEYHINELKKLIFSPGKKTDVPIIGNKTAIFSPKMAKYYNYSIQEKKFNNLDCHVFVASIKEEYTKRKEDKTVIKHLETYFEKGSHQVVARSYQLEYHGVFSFDIRMDIQVFKLKDNFYVPTHITYDGYWNVPFKSLEKCKFEMNLADFALN